MFLEQIKYLGGYVKANKQTYLEFISWLASTNAVSQDLVSMRISWVESNLTCYAHYRNLKTRDLVKEFIEYNSMAIIFDAGELSLD